MRLSSSEQPVNLGKNRGSSPSNGFTGRSVRILKTYGWNGTKMQNVASCVRHIDRLHETGVRQLRRRETPRSQKSSHFVRSVTPFQASKRNSLSHFGPSHPLHFGYTNTRGGCKKITEIALLYPAPKRSCESTGLPKGHAPWALLTRLKSR